MRKQTAYLEEFNIFAKYYGAINREFRKYANLIKR